MRAEYAFAWLIPLFAGAALVHLSMVGQRTPGRLAAMLGAGWFAGVFAAAGFAAWRGAGYTAHAFHLAWPWLVGIGVAAALVAIALRRRLHATVAAPRESAGRMQQWAWWLLLAIIVFRLAIVADEASLRPVFPWDAWSAWSLKPKAWMLLGRADDYVAMSQWLSAADPALRTVDTWNYPELLAWIQVWFASSAGGWIEPLVDLAWTGALAALGLAAYGYWRGIGVRAWLAMLLVYALLSLPLLEAHAALAGYADLWIAAVLGIATLAWSRWLVTRDRAQWWLACAFAACLPLIKIEGAIWLALFAAALILESMPRRWRWPTVGAVAAIVVVGLLVGGLSIPVVGLGWVRLAWGSVTIPGFESFELAWHPVGRSILASLFALPNWHLLWYLAPAIVVVRRAVLARDHAARMLAVLLLMQLAFLFVLFFFTAASAWAEDFTSANRLILQIVPGVFAFIAVLLRPDGAPPRDDRSHASDRPLRPA